MKPQVYGEMDSHLGSILGTLKLSQVSCVQLCIPSRVPARLLPTIIHSWWVSIPVFTRPVSLLTTNRVLKKTV